MIKTIRNFFCRDKVLSADDERLSEMREIFGSLTRCFSCRGFFAEEDLHIRWVGTASLDSDGVEKPVFEEVLYCGTCKPKASIIFILKDSAGEYLDKRHYKVEDGWFQELEDETGEDRYVVSLEEYQRAYCSECGNGIEASKCKVCYPPKKSRKDSTSRPTKSSK